MIDATPILYWVFHSSSFYHTLEHIDECQDQQKYGRRKHDAEDPLKCESLKKNRARERERILSMWTNAEKILFSFFSFCLVSLTQSTPWCEWNAALLIRVLRLHRIKFLPNLSTNNRQQQQNMGNSAQMPSPNERLFVWRNRCNHLNANTPLNSTLVTFITGNFIVVVRLHFICRRAGEKPKSIDRTQKLLSLFLDIYLISVSGFLQIFGCILPRNCNSDEIQFI